MPRLILITVLLLALCACAPAPAQPDPEKEAEIARARAADEAYWEERSKKAEAWPENFLALPQKPVNPLLDAWWYPDRVESDQSGSRTYHWIREDVSSSSSASRQSIYNEKGYYVGSYETQAAPIRKLRCEIHISADAAGLITKVSYAGPSCPSAFPLP